MPYNSALQRSTTAASGSVVSLVDGAHSASHWRIVGSIGGVTLGQEENDRRIDYIEFPATDIAATKRFYEAALGWEFTDYGPEYTSFSDGRLSGGFTTAGEVAAKGPLVVLYATDLDAVKKGVLSAGGNITQDTYEFPGGTRFHFRDPSGNELAIWTDN